MLRRVTLCVGMGFLTAVSPENFAEHSALDAATDASIREAIEQPRVSGSWVARPQFDVSPDRRRVTYVVETPNIGANIVAVDLWIADVGGRSPPRRLLRIRSQEGLGADTCSALRSEAPVNPAFSPDGNSIAVTAFGCNGALAIIQVRSGDVRLLTGNMAGPPVSFQDLAWSPDGKRLAVGYLAPAGKYLDRGVAVDVDWNGRSLARPTRRIGIINIKTDTMTATTPDTVDVVGIAGAFSWDPLGNKIAFSGHPSEKSDFNFRDDDIYSFDPISSAIAPLVALPGPDLDPRWSPDGAMIAFQSSAGDDALKTGLRLGFVDAKSGRQWFMPRADITGSPYSVGWLDHRHVSFVAMRRMGCPIFLADARTFHIRQISPDDLSCMSGTIMGAANTLIAVSHSFKHPAQLVESLVGHWAPRAVGPTSGLPRPAATESVIDWPSADGRYDVHGVLIEPEKRSNRPRPLLVVIAGGPGMVTPDVYNDDAQHLIFPALLRGYSVLIPNTRGRGGYGVKFATAISDHQDYMPGPLSDVLGGVDSLVHAGIADSNKVALAGYSYGAILASYAATKTQRFRAIMALEGAVDFYSRALDSFGSIDQTNGKAILGFSNPYDTSDRALLLSQSPLQGAASVRTPVLLECGIDSLAGSECLKFFRTVRQLSGSEIKLIVYPRTGHGIHEPALRYDSAVRQTAWLDQWIADVGHQATTDRDFGTPRQ